MAKNNVKIKKTPRKDGTTAISLVTYHGYSKTTEGKIKPNRTSKVIDFFLYTIPKNRSEKLHNKETEIKIEIIRAEKEKQLINNKYGFKSENSSKLNFISYLEKQRDKCETKSNYATWDTTLKHIKKYAGSNISFENINKKFCEGFKKHLQNTKTKAGKPLSNNTISGYFNRFRACLNRAVEDEIIDTNPAKKVSIPKVKESKREFLTEEEVKKLVNTECRYDVLKRAFLFSCLTGLRWSDINKLKWSEIIKEGDNWKIIFHQQKTKDIQYHYIPESANKFLGEAMDDNDRVFKGLQYSSYMNTALSQWILRAGITKNITFHCARHTYATLLLTKGTDLFTVSKMLGHKEIRTTQIYANILSQKKIDASDKLNFL